MHKITAPMVGLVFGLIASGLTVATSAPSSARASTETKPSTSDTKRLIRHALRTLPACPTEDSTDCAWRAGRDGNGTGRTFVSIGGVRYYLDTATVRK